MTYVLILFMYTSTGWIQADPELFPPHHFNSIEECEFAADYWNNNISQNALEYLGTNLAECQIETST